MDRAFAIGKSSLKHKEGCKLLALLEDRVQIKNEYLLLVMAEYPGASSLQPDVPLRHSNEGSNEGMHLPQLAARDVASATTRMKAMLMYILISIMRLLK